MFVSNATTPVKIGFASLFLTLRSPPSLLPFLLRGLFEALRHENLCPPGRNSGKRNSQLMGNVRAMSINFQHFVSTWIDRAHSSLKRLLFSINSRGFETHL